MSQTSHEGLKSAVKGTLEAIRAAHPDETLSAYALCTDDDLRTVFHMATTVEFCQQSDDPDIRYIPVDWIHDEGAELLEEANAQLVASLESATDFDRHVDESFGIFVEVLRELRAEGVFADDVALIVTSTDPGPRLEQLADAAMGFLNDDATHQEWRVAMGLD